LAGQGYGLNFRAYLQKLRLEKAAELLATTRLPVGTIARRVGGVISRALVSISNGCTEWNHADGGRWRLQRLVANMGSS